MVNDQSKEHSDFYYPGFQRPNTTPVPDDIFDLIAPELTEAELRVLLYIVRRTFGFKKDRDQISLSQMVDGIKTKDGKVLDRGTGLSRRGVMNGCAGLVAKGIIAVEKRRAEQGDSDINSYSLRFLDGPEVGKQMPYGRAPNAPRVGHQMPPQETVLQETVEQDLSNARMGSQSAENVDNSEAQLRPVATESSTFRLVPTEIRETANSGFTTVGNIVVQKSFPRPHQEYDEDRQVILNYIQDFAREFNDRASLKTSTTRAYNLFRQVQVSRDDFIARLYEAQALTKERTAAIRSTSHDAKQVFPLKHKMAYFFAILEDLLGLRSAVETDSPNGATRGSEPPTADRNTPRSRKSGARFDHS